MTTTAHNEIWVSLDGNIVAALPIELGELAAAIEQSKYLLALEHGFDAEDKITPLIEIHLALEDDFDNGSGRAYSPETWEKAVRFISGYAQWLFDIFGKVIVTPKIYHGPDGSIDLYWENPRFNLLINIPPGDEPATFYGDNYGAQVIEGKFDPAKFQQALLPDLSLISA
ncbi:MAG: hypothetical protein IPM98_17710 [Lewinellaceae bacterium]|nr:hypothetical protein [Lewinellaceae bacterium]